MSRGAGHCQRLQSALHARNPGHAAAGIRQPDSRSNSSKSSPPRPRCSVPRVAGRPADLPRRTWRSCASARRRGLHQPQARQAPALLLRPARPADRRWLRRWNMPRTAPSGKTCASRRCRRRSWSISTWKSGCCTTPSAVQPAARSGWRRSRSASTASRWCAASQRPVPAQRGRRKQLGRAPLPRSGLPQGRAAAHRLAGRRHRPVHLRGRSRCTGTAAGTASSAARPRPAPCAGPKCAGLCRLLPEQPGRPADRRACPAITSRRRRRQRRAEWC